MTLHTMVYFNHIYTSLRKLKLVISCDNTNLNNSLV